MQIRTEAREVLRITQSRSLMVLWAQQDPDSYMGTVRLGSKLIHMGGGGVAGAPLLCDQK